MRTLNSLVFALAAVAGSALTVPAEAQYNRRPIYDESGPREAHDHGYQSGLAAGREDARRGWAQDHNRHNAYRVANLGFRVGGLSIQFYQTNFRRGFDDGYRTGYAELRVGIGRGSSAGAGYYVDQPYAGRDYRDYRGDRYGNGRQSFAFDRGFADGFREGAEDGRDGDRYDVYGQRAYRRGSAGYNDRYGSRGRYTDDYRDGFRAGYDRGYRESARRGYANRGQWRRW